MRALSQGVTLTDTAYAHSREAQFRLKLGLFHNALFRHLYRTWQGQPSCHQERTRCVGKGLHSAFEGTDERDHTGQVLENNGPIVPRGKFLER